MTPAKLNRALRSMLLANAVAFVLFLALLLGVAISGWLL